MIPLWAIGGVVGLALLLFVRTGGEEGGLLADLLASITGRGSRVGRKTVPNELGVIEDDPWTLAAAAGMGLDDYALARMLSSEEGISPTLHKIGVGWAAVNASHGDVAAKLLAGKGASAGHFARQNARYLTGDVDADTGEPITAHAGKYASTALDPREDDAQIARAILRRQIADITGGATNFYAPRTQDALFAQGKVTKDAATVDANWQASGFERVEVDGIDPAELVFYRKGGSALG